jgi:hypothetical protein
MPPAVKALLESFDALSAAERLEAAVEILRRIGSGDAEISEEALLEAADEVFSTLDAEEAEVLNANPQQGRGLDR